MLKSQTSTANTAVSIVLPVEDGRYINIKNIYCGYSAAPTNGLLTVVEDGVTLFSQYIGAGFNRVSFETLRVATKDLTVTLSAGGSGIIGKLNLDLSYSTRY